MNLSYSYSRYECGIALLPDRIAVNGPRAKEILVASGFDSAMIYVTGAFRYPEFSQKVWRNPSKLSRSVVVALPGSLNEALELALKSFRALGGIPDVRLILKPHPTVPAGVLAPFLLPLSPNAAFSDEPPTNLLDRADLVLYTSTTVAVEALGRGIPLIHVKSDLAIDRNILEGFPMVPSAGDPQEIRALATSLLEKGGPPLEEARKAALEIFTPAGEGSIDLMLGVRK